MSNKLTYAQLLTKLTASDPETDSNYTINHLLPEECFGTNAEDKSWNDYADEESLKELSK